MTSQPLPEKLCPRCRREECVGWVDLLACGLVVDGMDPMGEALALLAEKYKPRPTLTMVCEVELLGGDRLVPWDADKDRRPKTKGGPRVGTVISWGAGHGECTACCRAKVAMQAAVWRRENRNGTTQGSYCQEHADEVVKQVTRILNRPQEVPQFADADAALRWLDDLTTTLER